MGQGQKAVTFFANMSQELSLGHIFFSTDNSWASSHSSNHSQQPLSSMLPLVWFITPSLKSSNTFLVQSPKVFPIPPNKSMIRPISEIPQSLGPISVLVRFLLLWRDTMIMATLIKELGWLIVQKFSSLSSQWEAWRQTGIHGAREVAKSSTFDIWIIRQQEERMTLDLLQLLKLQSPPPVIHFFQQGHTHLQKATPPNSATLYEHVGAIFIQTTTNADKV